ncbi:MAG TPA: hypothetical protein VEJ38_14975 [Candidatus Acidoferrales bacterium]|nr:hypothetical protein [Candidatus Acidoferrales bacterium]
MPSRSSNEIRVAALLLACATLPALGGCSEKTVHAAVPAAPVPTEEAMRPMTTAPDTDATPPPENATAPPPAVPVAAAPAPPVTIPAAKPSAPRRPVSEQASADAESQPTRPPAPQISPQLSPYDAATYQRKTSDDISVAESNLQQTNGKQLNAAQSDLAEKIRSFLSQSHDAIKDGDWARAQNLAQKARLLSAELINSL